MALVKPEMKSFIWVQTHDGSIQQVEEEVAMYCPMICREVLQTAMGSSKNYAIKLPQRVSPAVLGLILDYCRFHQVQGRSNKERKTFDEKLIRLDTKKLCELTSGADSLQLRPLVDLTSRALARMIEGKTPEEIRETFHLPDDLTEEEKLEPLRNRTDDPRIRLLNRLYARKRKELKVREKSKCMLENGETEEEELQRVVDDRSVEDLLLFINSGDEDTKGVKATKNKKKNHRRKAPSKGPCLNLEKETDSLCSSHNTSEIEEVGSPSKISKLLETDSPIMHMHMHSSSDFDFDDDLDPAMREQLDREVEDFARRLNSVWPERRMVSLGHDIDRRIAPLSSRNI